MFLVQKFNAYSNSLAPAPLPFPFMTVTVSVLITFAVPIAFLVLITVRVIVSSSGYRLHIINYKFFVFYPNLIKVNSNSI